MISKGEHDEMKTGKDRQRARTRGNELAGRKAGRQAGRQARGREKDREGVGGGRNRFYHGSLRRTRGTTNWRASESFTRSSRWKLGQKSLDISYNPRAFILRARVDSGSNGVVRYKLHGTTRDSVADVHGEISRFQGEK